MLSVRGSQRFVIKPSQNSQKDFSELSVNSVGSIDNIGNLDGIFGDPQHRDTHQQLFDAIFASDEPAVAQTGDSGLGNFDPQRRIRVIPDGAPLPPPVQFVRSRNRTTTQNTTSPVPQSGELPVIAEANSNADASNTPVVAQTVGSTQVNTDSDRPIHTGPDGFPLSTVSQIIPRS